MRRAFAVLLGLTSVGCMVNPATQPRSDGAGERAAAQRKRDRAEARERERVAREQRAAAAEAEWPEATPSVWIKGEPAPVSTATAPKEPVAISAKEQRRRSRVVELETQLGMRAPPPPPARAFREVLEEALEEALKPDPMVVRRKNLQAIAARRERESAVAPNGQAKVLAKAAEPEAAVPIYKRPLSPEREAEIDREARESVRDRRELAWAARDCDDETKLRERYAKMCEDAKVEIQARVILSDRFAAVQGQLNASDEASNRVWRKVYFKHGILKGCELSDDEIRKLFRVEMFVDDPERK